MHTETKKLQDRLAKTPLVPLNPTTRRQRDKLQAKLLETARKHWDVSEINLMAGVY